MFVPGMHCNQGHPLDTMNPASPKEDGSPGRPTCSCHLCGQAIESTDKYFSHCEYNCCNGCFKGKEKLDLIAILEVIKPEDYANIQLDTKEIQVPYHKCTL